MKRFALGAGSGLTAAFFAVRSLQAIRDVRSPAPRLRHDAAAYGRLRRAQMVSGIARSVAALGWFAFAAAPRIEGKPSRVKRVAMIAGGLALDTLAGTPNDYIEDFVVERSYGLSDQTAGRWLAERAKAGAINVAVAVPVIEMLTALIERAPRTWPLGATAATVPLLILANLVVPVFIAPVFNTFEPVGGELERRIRALAERYGVGDAAILRVDMSRQTRKANAYVTGMLGTHRIVLGDTLIDSFTPAEIEFVVAHELGHYVARDTWRFVAVATSAAAVIFLASKALAGPVERPASVTALSRLAFYATLVSLGVTPLISAFSRSREWAADRFALQATRAPNSGIAAFTRLRDQNMAEDEQPRWMEALFATHPPLGKRIAALRA
jgi:STE24 endopeptidase